MATWIRNKTGSTWGIPQALWALLPTSLREDLTRTCPHLGRIEELRVRCGRQTCLVTSLGTVVLSYVPSRSETDELVLRLCKGSVYAYRESIAKGYLTLADGVRVGICGRASVEGERIVGVYDIDGLNIRLPCGILPVGEVLCRRLREGRGGLLIYAPPGEGKTTLLRGVAASMASGNDAWSVAVVDSRGELFPRLEDPRLSLDVLTGYPRALGFEIALRTMNPRLIVCDEIGEAAEAESILKNAHGGVPFLATAHGCDLVGMLRSDRLLRLHEAKIFEAYVGIHRRCDAMDYVYEITEWRDADGLLANERLSVASS
ncbi:MAG: hypothetical protein IKA76_06595 [Clostridia bacterium]|nr:hypothetical protein [Clostridia bacterium]